MEETHTVRITVNGELFDRTIPVRILLSDYLRDTLGLTGTHVACEQGVCGACTVILDGEAVRSCLLFAVQADGSDVTTIEGIGGPLEPNAVQRAMHEEHALQCGFCTAGIVVSLTRLLEQTGKPSKEEVMDALGGHLCRCTGYVNIRRAAIGLAGEVEGL